MALSERYSAILDKCIGSLTTWKNFINNENWDDSDKDIEIAKLRKVVEEYCILDGNHKRSQNAIELVEQSISNAAENYNIDQMFKEKLSEQDVEDVTSNEIWEQIFNVDVSVQEIRPKKNNTQTQYEEVDDSLLCSNSFTAPIDPISKKVICKPIRNRKCKHVYDNNSIYDYIRQAKNKAKCPYMGCKNNKLLVSDLQQDAQLEEKISEYLQSQENESNEDNSD